MIEAENLKWPVFLPDAVNNFANKFATYLASIAIAHIFVAIDAGPIFLVTQLFELSLGGVGEYSDWDCKD